MNVHPKSVNVSIINKKYEYIIKKKISPCPGRHYETCEDVTTTVFFFTQGSMVMKINIFMTLSSVYNNVISTREYESFKCFSDYNRKNDKRDNC